MHKFAHKRRRFFSFLLGGAAALLMPDASESRAMANVLNKTAPQDLDLCLYTNNYTPIDASVVGDFTEAAGNGYALIQLVAANWTITAGAPTEGVYPQQIFTFTGPLGLVYGYFLRERTSGLLKWAERFSGAGAPYNMINNGDQIKVTPKFQFRKVGE